MRSLLTFILPLMATAEPFIIAHRGASHAAPENTLAAFELAWKEGADGIEGDFRLTSDDRIVCIHDTDTKRTTGRKLIVSKTPFETLRSLDAGSWKHPDFKGEPIPLFQEILDSLPAEKFFVVEIKCGPKIIEPMASMLEERAADPKRIILISFDPEVVRGARARLPDFQSHLISKLENVSGVRSRRNFFKTYKDSEATGLQFKHTARITREWLEIFRESGHLTASWTVDTPADARRVRDLGVNFITTNRPAAIREALETNP